MAHWWNLTIRFDDPKPDSDTLATLIQELKKQDYDFPIFQHGQEVSYRYPELKLLDILAYFDEHGFPCKGLMEPEEADDWPFQYAQGWQRSENYQGK